MPYFSDNLFSIFLMVLSPKFSLMVVSSDFTSNLSTPTMEVGSHSYYITISSNTISWQSAPFISNFGNGYSMAEITNDEHNQSMCYSKLELVMFLP
jgi:hypothetical protein